MLFFLCNIIFSPAYAQKFKASLEAGTSISNFYGDINGDLSKFRTGINMGLALESRFRPNSAVNIKALIQQKGYKLKGSIPLVNDRVQEFNNRVILTYLTIPVAYKKYILGGLFSLNGGVYISLLLRESVIKEESTVGPDGLEYGSYMESLGQIDYRTADAGVFSGFTIHPLDRWYLDVKYSLGLANVASDQNELETVKNQSVELLIGFHLSKESD
jgi:hypothetical protein